MDETGADAAAAPPPDAIQDDGPPAVASETADEPPPSPVAEDDLNIQIDELAKDDDVGNIVVGDGPPSDGAEEESQPSSIQSPEDISLYSLIIRQLADDGFAFIANELAMAVGIEIDQAIPERKLASIVSSQDQDQEQEDDTTDPMQTDKDQQQDGAGDDATTKYQPSDREDAMNLTIDRESLSSLSRPFPTYTSRFVALHKNAVRAGGFSADGNYAASASNDFSIKYLDVDKMHYYSQLRGSDDSASRPVIRTYYDHSGPITQVVFHPVRDFLVSASQDATVKIFDLQRSTVKKSFKHIKENSSVNSIDFHPSGDFLICGTDRPQVYMYDMNTFQRYCTSDQKMFHQGPITWVQYARQAKYYASCSTDGSIKIWDGVNSHCVRTIAHAHSGAPVSDVQFSMNGKYILSGGRDSTSRLWDVATGKLVFTYEGAVHNQSGRINIKSAFSFNDEFILSGDEMSGNITVWDTRTGTVAKKTQTHTKSVTWIVSSPVEPAILTCSEDGTAKFWTAD